MTNIFILLGGIWSFDGPVTSSGMYMLRSMLSKLPNVSIKTYLWASWTQCYNDVMAAKDEKVAIIGFSGGAMKETWVANGCVLGAHGIIYLKRPNIDLLVAYDPSPAGSVQLLGKNVKRAVCYYNAAPWMFGLGGGRLGGDTDIQTITIREQHLAVQTDMALHRRTVAEVARLQP
jgi:hypothetical protein